MGTTIKIDNTLQKYRPPFKKRWGNIFFYDKILPSWVRTIAKIGIWGIDPFWKTILFIERRKKKWVEKQYYCSICAIFKDEELSLKEWIEYHKLIGINHIFLYNNNSTDNYNEIIQPYINEEYLTLINWPMEPPAQVQAYSHFKKNFEHLTNWVAFIDLDEYICPKRVLDIRDWLSAYENYPCITMYWRMFGSSGLLKHDSSKLILEQYTLAWDKLNEIGKAFFNTRFDSASPSQKTIHELPARVKLFGQYFEIPPINEFKYFVKYRCNRIGLLKKQSDFTLQLNHYATKSYSNFFIDRKIRGDVNNFKKNSSIGSYIYTQSLCIKEDKCIHRFLTFLKVRLNLDNIENYLDNKE